MKIRFLIAALLLLSSPCWADTASPAIACPALAKLCPDGSSVSPHGPHCEMAACPGMTAKDPTVTPAPAPTVSNNPLDAGSPAHEDPGPPPFDRGGN